MAAADQDGCVVFNGYSSRDVARLLGVSPAQVRRYVKVGFVHPTRLDSGEFRFSFRDLAKLRYAQGLTPDLPGPIRPRVLEQIAAKLEGSQSLQDVKISTHDGKVLFQDRRGMWESQSGQGVMPFARETTPTDPEIAFLVPIESEEMVRRIEDELTAEDWYLLGMELESNDAGQARDAYRRCLELEPQHLDARLNLGRLLHEAGEAHSAEAHYRLVLGCRPNDPTAAYNLGVALEDLGRAVEAITSYERAIANDPRHADAHYNLARLYESLGNEQAAVRHFRIYSKLST